MVKVVVWGSLRDALGGRDHVEVEARDIRELLARLREQHPALRPQLERGVSVSVDGTVYANAWLTELRPDSEVVLLPRIAGG